MSSTPFTPNEYDVLVGRMLVTMRTRFGLSQKDLAQQVGVTFQQIQKYESASNRLSVSRLHQIVTKCFDMTLSEFFGDVDQPYNQNTDLTKIIRKFDGMNPTGRKMMIQMAKCIALAHPKSNTVG